MKFVPAPLTPDVTDLFQQIDRFLPYFSLIQLDIADGKFVPNTTVSMEQVIEYLQKLPDPYKYHNLKLDLHLMVKDYYPLILLSSTPHTFIPVNSILIHETLKPDYPALQKEFPDKVIGLVLNPDDDVQIFRYKDTINMVPSIQIMSVNPGFQGSPFIPNTLNKIEQLRKLNYRNTILLDGGVHNTTLPVILSKEYIPDIAGVVSYFSKAEDVKEHLDSLTSLVEASPHAQQ